MELNPKQRHKILNQAWYVTTRSTWESRNTTMKLSNFLGRASLGLKKLKKRRTKIPNKSILITQRFPSTDKFQEINRMVNNFVLPSNSLRERANSQRLGKQDWKLQSPITKKSTIQRKSWSQSKSFKYKFEELHSGKNQHIANSTTNTEIRRC